MHGYLITATCLLSNCLNYRCNSPSHIVSFTNRLPGPFGKPKCICTPWIPSSRFPPPSRRSILTWVIYSTSISENDGNSCSKSLDWLWIRSFEDTIRLWSFEERDDHKIFRSVLYNVSLGPWFVLYAQWSFAILVWLWCVSIKSIHVSDKSRNIMVPRLTGVILEEFTGTFPWIWMYVCVPASRSFRYVEFL